MVMPLPQGLKVLVRRLGSGTAVVRQAPKVFEHQGGRVASGWPRVRVIRAQQGHQGARNSEDRNRHEHATNHQNLAERSSGEEGGRWHREPKFRSTHDPRELSRRDGG